MSGLPQVVIQSHTRAEPAVHMASSKLDDTGTHGAMVMLCATTRTLSPSNRGSPNKQATARQLRLLRWG